MSEMKKWLDSEIEDYPWRASGEELYEYIRKKVAPYVTEERNEVVEALREWIDLRKEPHTMIAVDLAAKFNISEVSSDIDLLLMDVKKGKVFKEFYERPIKDSLKRMAESG